MQFKKILILIILSILIVACNKKGGSFSDENISSKNVKIIFDKGDVSESMKLNGQPLGFAEHLKSPRRMMLKDSLLIVTDKNPKTQLQIFDIRNNAYIRHFGEKGYGPNELMSTWTLDYGMEEESFWVFDIQQKKMNEYSLNQNSSLAVSQLKFENDLVSCLEPIWLTDSTLIGLTYDGMSKFSTFDIKGNVIERFGDWEGMVRQRNSLNVISQLYQGKLHASPNRGYFLLSCIYLDHLELFDFNRNVIIEITGPDRIEPNYSEEEIRGYAVFVPSPEDTHYGYVDAYVGNNNIYGLYSGQQWKGSPTGKQASSILYKFDFTGKVTGMLQLDRLITSFTIDEQNEVLYGVSFEENPDVIKFSLK